MGGGFGGGQIVGRKGRQRRRPPKSGSGRSEGRKGPSESLLKSPPAVHPLRWRARCARPGEGVERSPCVLVVKREAAERVGAGRGRKEAMEDRESAREQEGGRGGGCGAKVREACVTTARF